MVDSAQRLLALLHGERVAKPPFWEPWWLMNQLVTERYGGDLLACAAELDLAAVRLPGVGTNTIATQPVTPTDKGAYYAGGGVRSLAQLRELPEPDWDRQVEQLLPYRRQAAEAGRACWLVIVGCFPALNVSLGLEAFAYACHDEPAEVAATAEWVEARNRVAVERVVAQVRPDFVLWDSDMAYKTNTMIRPDAIRDLFAEPMRQSIATVHALGLPVALHSDGRLDPLIPLLCDLGVAAVHGCEAQANELAELVARFGDDIVLCGNMDVVFLTHATPAQIREATAAMLATGAAKGRFAAGCNTSPMDYIPAENYLAFAETVRDWQPA